MCLHTSVCMHALACECVCVRVCWNVFVAGCTCKLDDGRNREQEGRLTASLSVFYLGKMHLRFSFPLHMPCQKFAKIIVPAFVT